MRAFRFAVALMAAACIHVSASAQQGGSAVVTGDPAQARTSAFVEQISLISPDNALARWDTTLCVGAVGLSPSEAQLLVDRISARAQGVGLRTGAPGCHANVMIIYAPDSDALAHQIVDQRRDLLGYFAEDGRVTAGREALAAFANTRPIRWWHVSETGAGSLRPEEGLSRQNSNQTAAMAAGNDMSAPALGTTQDMQGMEAVRTNGSRARPQVRNNLSYVLVVVDARRVAGVSAAAWMDYVAMVTLAQLDAQARPTGFPTILNLFSQSESTAPALTAWDTAYLEALYGVRSNVGRRQAADIARRMADDVRGAQ